MSCQSVLEFPQLPLWTGVMGKPGIYKCFPYSLGWDSRGFIRQTTPDNIQKQVIAAYSNPEYSFITSPPGSSRWATGIGKVYVDFTLRFMEGAVGKSILEIGGGNLFLAETIAGKTRAKNYTVVDPALASCRAGLETIQVIPEYFGETPLDGKDFDFVLAFNCLEHVSDPVLFLKNIRKSIRNDGGRAIFVIPDTERQLASGDPTAILHEHISCFTESTVRHVMAKCGLEIFHCERWNENLFLCAESAAVADDRSPSPPDKFILGIPDRFRNGMETARLLLSRANEGDTPVAIHGATNGLNNLLFLLNFEPSDRIMLFDGDETKTGKFLPAFPFPIKHSSDLAYDTVRHVLVAATSFFNPIRDFLTKEWGLTSNNVQPLFPLNS